MSRSRSLTLVLALVLAAPITAETPVVTKAPSSRVQDLLSKPDDTVVEGPDGKKTTVGELKIQLRTAMRATGESPAKAGLGEKLKADLVSANAATRASLARIKQSLSPAVARLAATPTPTHGGLGNLAKKMPCDRVLFNVEGAAVNFQIQPGQLILLNGCFAGAPNAEVRIAGNFPPYGYLLLNIQDRGDSYFYGEVPDVIGVPDQNISITIRFFDGVTTNARNGFFYAKRQSWESAAPSQKICNALQVNSTDGSNFQFYNPSYEELGCSLAHFDGGGIDVWTAAQKEKGFRITKFWWTAIHGGPFSSKDPQMRFSDDGSTVQVGFSNFGFYGASRVRIEGPAGLPPF
jgi:hypothetical protein